MAVCVVDDAEVKKGYTEAAAQSRAMMRCTGGAGDLFFFFFGLGRIADNYDT